MKSVCAWCKTLLSAGEATDDSRPVTHGICLSCAQKFLADLPQPLRDFLDGLGVPVLVVDGAVIVRTANARACELLDKDVHAVEDRRAGLVVECLHATKPGGCGEQLHCQSCTIRKTVLETYATGRSFHQIPAYPDLQNSDGIRRALIEISTERVGDLVLLRIHEIETGNIRDESTD